MKILISPAKSLDFENKVVTKFDSKPVFSQKTIEINSIIRELSAPDLSCLLYTSPSPRDLDLSRMPSSA